MATIRQRGKSWQAQVKYPDGTVRAKSFPTKALAKAWATEGDAAKASGEAITHDRAAVTVADLWAIFLPMRVGEGMKASTARKYRSHWSTHLEGAWGQVPVKGIRQSQIRQWVVRLRKAGVGQPTIAGSLSLLSALFAVAMADDLIGHNPAHGVTPGEHEVTHKAVPTRGQMGRVLEAIPDPGQRLLIETLAVTGLRIGEALGLRAVDVDPAHGVIRVRQVWTRDGIRDGAKTKLSVRDVPVPPGLLARLSRVGAIGNGRVFAGDDRNLNRRVLAPACRKAKVPVITLHTLRKYATTQLLDAGMSAFHIAKTLGHKDTRMIERIYGQMTDDGRDAIRNAMARIGPA